jgi:hypothetical protein
LKEDNHRSDDKNSEGVAESPEYADEASLGDSALPRNDGGNGDHVIRIGGMTHAQKKRQNQNGE